jgi:uncharacterized protein (TIGR02001 family)
MSKFIGLAAGLAAMAILAGAARAEESAAPKKVGLSFSADYSSRYVWRGIPINMEPVVQPSLTFAGAGFSLNFWANFDTTDWGERHGGYGDQAGNLTENDFTGGYERTVGKAALGLGFVDYAYPHWPGNLSTTEVYFKLGFEVPLSPSITTYLDENAAEGANYTSLDLSHSFKLWSAGETSLGLDLSAHAGYANGKCVRAYYGGYGLTAPASGWHDWSLAAALPFSLPHGFSITPAYTRQSLWNRDIRELINDTPALNADNDVLSLTVGWEGEL